MKETIQEVIKIINKIQLLRVTANITTNEWLLVPLSNESTSHTTTAAHAVTDPSLICNVERLSNDRPVMASVKSQTTTTTTIYLQKLQQKALFGKKKNDLPRR